MHVQSSDRAVQEDSTHTHLYRAKGRFSCSQLLWLKERERRRESEGKDVEETQEIPESREVSGGSQTSSRERPAKTDTSNPPRQGVEGGTSDPRAVGLRDRDRAAQPELEEREREIAERETQAERHRAPAHVSEGGDVGCSII